MARVAELQAETQQALEAAIAAQALPSNALIQADKLLGRLQTATRITLVGRPGSGKSAIVNLLAGEDVVPLALQLCTLQLVYGPEQRATVTLQDGSNLEMDGSSDLKKISAMTPVFLKIEAPLPALKKISILEVVTSTDRVEQIRALAWASKQTDIAIWCTEDYDATEQTLWADVPDAIKDHAILVRTRADMLGPDRNATIKALTHHAGADFAHVMAISAHEAQAARDNPGGVDKESMKNSGAIGLISTILRQIENGRQYAVDQAEILLRKHEGYQPKTVEKKPAKTVEPVVEVVQQPVAEVIEDAVQDATPKVMPDSAVRDDVVKDAADGTVDKVADAPLAKASEVTADPIVDTVPEPVVDVQEIDTSETLRTLCGEATERLQKAGQDLAEMDEVTPKVILNRAANDIVWLSDHLADAEMPKNDDFKQLNTWVRDAEDLIQLLRIEGDDDSATDAITTLLQLKRGFQAQLAA